MIRARLASLDLFHPRFGTTRPFFIPACSKSHQVSCSYTIGIGFSLFRSSGTGESRFGDVWNQEPFQIPAMRVAFSDSGGGQRTRPG